MLQSQIDEMAKRGGGRVQLPPRAVTRCVVAPIIKAGVQLDLNNGVLLLTPFGGDDYGVRLRSGSSLVRGRVEVHSSGKFGDQAGIHAAVNIGPHYGDAGTVARASPDEGVHDWLLSDLDLSTDGDGKVAVQVTGGANAGIIENIRVPSSNRMFGAIHLDWGYVGPLSSANIAAAVRNHRLGLAKTTHPHDIRVRNITVGKLRRRNIGDDTGSHAVRLSGVRDVSVSGVRAAETTYSGLRITAGDLGFEFADARDLARAMQGIRIDDFKVSECGSGYLALIDAYADNLARYSAATGYRAKYGTVYRANIVLEGLTGATSTFVPTHSGIHIHHLAGAQVRDCVARGFLGSISQGEGATDIRTTVRGG